MRITPLLVLIPLSLVVACASSGGVLVEPTSLSATAAPAADSSSIDLTRIDTIRWDATSASESLATLDLASEPIGDPFGSATSNLDLASLDYAAIEPARMWGDDGIKVGDSYTLLRLGAFDPAGDTRDLDTGYWAEIAFGRCIAHFFSIEAVTGFYKLTGDSGAEVYGMPLMINGRVGIPIVIVEPYAGIGVGGVWAHTEIDGFSDEDSFAGMGNAFLGVEVGLGGFALGLEYKYLKTADLDVPGGFGDFNLEGHVLFLTGRMPF